MERNIVSRVRKRVLILDAKYKYKLNNLFFAQILSRIRSIYVSIFCTQCSFFLHIFRNYA